jgi:hypothetical protein
VGPLEGLLEPLPGRGVGRARLYEGCDEGRGIEEESQRESSSRRSTRNWFRAWLRTAVAWLSTTRTCPFRRKGAGYGADRGFAYPRTHFHTVLLDTPYFLPRLWVEAPVCWYSARMAARRAGLPGGPGFRRGM